jgi:alkyl hydroperoxide reductase subunit AhpC
MNERNWFQKKWGTLGEVPTEFLLIRIKELDERNPNSFAIIGIHNPIFENEKNYNSVKKAVIRHEISYPVINDSNLDLAKKFNVNNNPSFLIFSEPNIAL